jgi:exosortase
LRTGLAAALVCSLVWLYGGLAWGLVVQWVTSPDASYGAILAAVAALLVWQRRAWFTHGRPPSRAATFGGLALATLGFMAYLAGLFSADLFTTRASLVFVAAGLTLFLLGAEALGAAAAPLAFFFLSIPLPELIVTKLTASLQTVAARTAELALFAAGVPVYRDGNILELPAATLQIAQACSGLRSVVSLASVGVLLAWATPGSPPRRAALAAATIPIAVLVNGLRVAATGAATQAWGPTMTQDPWHSLAGWLTFVVSLAALWGIRRALLHEAPPALPAEVVRA